MGSRAWTWALPPAPPLPPGPWLSVRPPRGLPGLGRAGGAPTPGLQLQGLRLPAEEGPPGGARREPRP